MARLEDLCRDASVRGVLPDRPITVVDVRWHGTQAIELTYKDPGGAVGTELLFRDREPTLEIVTSGRPWSFDGDGALFKLVSEAYRIRLGHLFDPYLAVSTSLVEPLPHQITAVYEELIKRQPLRFLLADDPGAGKTIMSGLFIKELIVRGDVERCLICCPGNLAEQWQDELADKFGLAFDIISRETIETSRTGNPLTEYSRVLIRLDHFSRNETLQEKLKATDWDLVIVDEAHRMSATYYGNELKETKRYKLGKLLGRVTRHLLLLTATPHNGKDPDFQLFMALLDGDRFEGRLRDGAHVADTSDLMRRLTKEDMYRFDGRRLFPERRAHTVTFELSDGEAHLYEQVTQYVRNEMNRADRLKDEGQERRGNTVGFALTILQRRLASSPEAIYRSLQRRKARLESRLDEERLLRRGQDVGRRQEAGGGQNAGRAQTAEFDLDDLDDLDEAPDAEISRIEDQVVDEASTARTIEELGLEIQVLKELEALARTVVHSGEDRKWRELSRLINETREMFDETGSLRKLVIFTEHRDTLRLLKDRIVGMLGKPEAVTEIHGQLAREDRRRSQDRFTQDADCKILLATDAAGEGINLQRAHLMVNYDLPWNPNRLEQRFGRIHRIGQTEVCHMWNLVADQTREGDVYRRLLDKVEEESLALGGKVFDVLGQVFRETSLKDLLIQAIRYGDQPEVKLRLEEVVDNAFDPEKLRELIEEEALTHDTMDLAAVRRIRDAMERAQARKLQPHFISAFFMQGFKHLGGVIRQRERDRYEITRVPGSMRARDRLIGDRQVLQPRYERVSFDKDLRYQKGKPMAEFVCPGHPLLDTTVDLVLERHGELLKRGAVLVDPTDPSDEVRALIYLEDAIQDGRMAPRTGQRRVISRRLHLLETTDGVTFTAAGHAPYLDYRPLDDAERSQVEERLDAPWLRKEFESRAIGYAIEHLVPRHLAEVKEEREDLAKRTQVAVKERLTQEIRFWDYRASELKEKEEMGKTPRLNSAKARQRAEELTLRLEKRLQEIELERQISAKPPVLVGGCLVVPQGLLDPESFAAAGMSADAQERMRVSRRAVQAVLEAERALGRDPKEMPHANPGYDVESKGLDGRLLFIEVKGRVAGARTVTLTRNEILTGLNKPDTFILALVVVDGEDVVELKYLRRPFEREPAPEECSVNYDLGALLGRGTEPA